MGTEGRGGAFATKIHESLIIKNKADVIRTEVNKKLITLGCERIHNVSQNSKSEIIRIQRTPRQELTFLSTTQSSKNKQINNMHFTVFDFLVVFGVVSSQSKKRTNENLVNGKSFVFNKWFNKSSILIKNQGRIQKTFRGGGFQ